MPDVNPDLSLLQPYPFEKLRQLLAGVTPNPALREIKLSIGEPQHATPALIKRAMTTSLDGLANYPATLGLPVLREAIAAWIGRRYRLPLPDAATQVLPVNGSREALFAFAQAVIDRTRPGALVLCPNPFYQIYEGAALLAGATAALCQHPAGNRFRDGPRCGARGRPGRDVQLVYVCSPGNPTGKVMRLALAAAVRAFRPLRLRHRLRRVLFRDLFRRGQAAAGRAGSRA
jgi:N-succinyldiaminopimelate aminotransferase